LTADRDDVEAFDYYAGRFAPWSGDQVLGGQAAAPNGQVERGDVYPEPSANGHRAPGYPNEPPEAVVRRVADVSARRVRWLWPGRVALGTVTLLDGDPGLGKSQLTLDLAARVSCGCRMPPEERAVPDPDRRPAGVLLLSAEDDVASAIRPRLEAAGADLTRIHVLDAVRQGDDSRPPMLPFDLDVVEQVIRATDALLVIIDPLMAYLDPEINSYRDQDVRRAMHRLKLLAERTGVAVLVVRHLNKATGGPALYRGGGSIGLVGAARSALVVGTDPQDAARRILAPNKCNLAAPPASLTFGVEACADTSRIVWLGECALTADDVLARPRAEDRSNRVEQAVDWLRALLKDFAYPSDEILAAAKAAGFRFDSVKDAKARLKADGLEHHKDGFTGRWWSGFGAYRDWRRRPDPGEAHFPSAGPGTAEKNDDGNGDYSAPVFDR